jgi:aryl-alcohol dehydrogenase-like predicted oxidoreductase
MAGEPGSGIERLDFGRTGHRSTRLIFGAAALGAMRQEKADRVIEEVLGAGINHFDTAAGYGDSEARLGPWIRQHRVDVFLASKTEKRTRVDARESIHRSLERLQTDHLDLIQLHNLVEPDEWEIALAPGGALEAAQEAQVEGLVRFIGVTGHGTRIPSMHLRSLERFSFDSVLLPYNFTMMSRPRYAADFEALDAECRSRGVALQTIKSLARGRWADEKEPHFSWYAPIRDPEAVSRAVRWVLSRPGAFLNTSSDATLLTATIDAARHLGAPPSEQEMEHDVTRLGIRPLFEPGALERI